MSRKCKASISQAKSFMAGVLLGNYPFICPPPKNSTLFFSLCNHQQHFCCYVYMADKNSALPNEAQPSPNETQPPSKTPPPPDKTQPLLQKGRAQNPHDAFFKDILANIAHATAVMRYILDADIVAVLDWDKMEPQKDTFITPAGRELRADALFKLPFKEAGKDDYVYLLLEHKSTQPSGINSQLRNYTHQIYNEQQTLHLVIPIVFYHGRLDGNSHGGCAMLSHYQKSTEKCSSGSYRKRGSKTTCCLTPRLLSYKSSHLPCLRNYLSAL